MELSARDKALISGVPEGYVPRVAADAFSVTGGRIGTVGEAMPVDVVVRFRPLVGDEVKESHEAAPRSVTVDGGDDSDAPPRPGEPAAGVLGGAGGAQDATSGAAGASVEPRYTVRMTAESKGRSRSFAFNGFRRVLGEADDNAALFDAAVRPKLAHVLRGGRVCVFAYGHTGSGKTHSLLGSGGATKEVGVVERAARALLEGCAPAGLHIAVRFCELHNKRVFDLLDGRAECHVREGPDGCMYIRGATHKDSSGDVTVRPPACVRARTVGEVAGAVEAGTAHRRTGSSTLHDESSRSHAILELELTTDAVEAAREELLRAQGVETAVGKHHTDLAAELGLKLLVRNPETGSYSVASDAVGEEAHAEVEARFAALTKATDARYEAEERLREVIRAAPEGVTGSVLFIDLAGSEYADEVGMRVEKQTPAERREAKEINTSLLALKECVRALAKGGGGGDEASSATTDGDDAHAHAAHVPFRNSRLTMLLKRHLLAGAHTTVLATASPSAVHAAKTVNTLRYAQLVAGGRRGGSAARTRKGTAAVAGRTSLRDRMMGGARGPCGAKSDAESGEKSA